MRLVSEGALIVGPFAGARAAVAIVEMQPAGIDAAVLDWNVADGTTQLLAEQLARLEIPFLFCTSGEQQVQGGSSHPVLPKAHLEWLSPRLATLLGR